MGKKGIQKVAHYLLLTLFLWNLLLTLLFLFFGYKYWRSGGGRGKNLESENFGKALALLQKEAREIRQESAGFLRKVGVVRFNPFSDLGGDQSFAVAILDKDKKGLVLSSLHGREGTRIFAKEVEKSESKNYSLSAEEKEAIARAGG